MLVSSESQTLLRECECQTPLHITMQLAEISGNPKVNECSSLDVDFENHALSAYDVDIVRVAKVLLELTDESSRLDQASIEKMNIDMEARARFREFSSLVAAKQNDGELERHAAFMEHHLYMIRRRSQDRLRNLEDNIAKSLHGAGRTLEPSTDKRILKLLQALERMGRERTERPRTFRRRTISFPPIPSLSSAERVNLCTKLRQARQSPTEGVSTAIIQRRDKLLSFLNKYIAHPRAIPIY